MTKRKKFIRLRWTPNDEWLIVAYGARDHLAAGWDRFSAVKRAQQLLPRHRQVNDEEIKRRTYPSSTGLDNALAHLKTMSPEEIAALLQANAAAQATPLPATAPVHNDVPVAADAYVPRGASRLKLPTYDHPGHLVRWNPREWALLARRVAAWQAAGSTAGVLRLVAEAQEIEMPPHRRRPYNSISVNTQRTLLPRLELGAKQAHLIEDVPLDLKQRAWQEQRPLELAAEAPSEAPSEPQEAPMAFPAPPAAPPQTDRFWDDQPFAPHSSATAAAPSLAQASAQLFGETLAATLVPLVERMLAAHEQAVLASVREQQREHAQQLAATMSRQLLADLDRLLGGSTPAAPAPAPVEAHVHNVPPEHPSDGAMQEHPRAAKIKVDIVGFEEGQYRMLVQRRLNGSAQRLDLRFVHPDTQSSYTPQRDRHVILLTSRVPHSIRSKIEACGCPIHRARRTVDDVVQIVAALARDQSPAS